ncbi:TPA: helix-turn-helix transcriptional regulator, partial [Morganella morganii]|nr:helix-turn-helix transcriptional regulator [Morganella morganii]
MKNINLIVGQNIRTLRYHHGMTTKTLAKLLEVSQQQVSRYERG